MRKVLSILLLFIGFSGFSQLGGVQKVEMPADQVDWEFTVEQDGCDAVIIAQLKVREGWHINATSLPEGSFGIPTTFQLQPSNDFKTIGGIIEPQPIEEFDKISGELLRYHKGSFLLKQKIKVTSSKDFTLTIDFGFQPCDSVKCLFPFQDAFTVQVKGCKVNKSQPNTAENQKVESENETASNTTDSVGSTKNNAVLSDSSTLNAEKNNKKKEVAQVTAGNKDTEKNIKEFSLWWIFVLSFGSGLIALLTPCVFPMIPMTVSFFTKKSETKAKGIRNAVKYGVSIIVIYVLLGTLVTWIFGADSMNNLSTDPTFNIIFFLVLLIFAISFLGAFEIRLPSSWANKVDAKADKGGFLGIFFMALALAIVSFSCTGPIVGYLLVIAATTGGIAPFIGMFGFSLALALPFALFAAFPGWLNTMPKSGGWLNTIKVVLGFIELAFAFKFLSNADLALQLHLLEREAFIAIWIGIFLVLTFYLFGWIRLPLDNKMEKLSVGRTMFGTFTLIFVFYMIPGLWGAPLKLISAFPPPMSYSESPYGVGKDNPLNSSSVRPVPNENMHLGPQNIMVFYDYKEALAYSKKVNKPLLIDFTGWNCVNCRRMEESVWGEPGVINILRDSLVIASLHVDSKVALPKNEWKEVTLPNGRKKTLKTVGDKWMFMELSRYRVAAQPYYIMQNTKGEDLANGSADYFNYNDPKDFLKWLQEGMEDFRENKLAKEE